MKVIIDTEILSKGRITIGEFLLSVKNKILKQEI